MRFEELKTALETAPPTWVPALLRALVKRAADAFVFAEGGLLRFVGNVLNEHHTWRLWKTHLVSCAACTAGDVCVDGRTILGDLQPQQAPWLNGN